MTVPNLPSPRHEQRLYEEDLHAAIQAQETAIKELGAAVTALSQSTAAALTDLTTRVTALESGSKPPPPSKPQTMFGAGIYHSTKGTNYDQEWALHRQHTGTPTIVRAFGTVGGFTWTWPNVPGMRQKLTVEGVTNAWVSFKPTNTELVSIANGTLNAKIMAMVGTIPTDHTYLLTLYHEPEDNAASGSISFETWLRANVAMGEAVKTAGRPNVRFGPIFMGSWYINGVPATNKGHLPTLIANAKTWGLYDRWKASVDFIGWDPYHEGSTTGKVIAPRDDPAYYFQAPLDFTHEHFPGTPMAIGETGFVAQGTPGEQAKVAWLNRAADWSRQHDLVACCYYDAMLTTPWYLTFVKDTATIDTASTAAWGANYQ